ncbi:MAG: response regulator transcription factor [Candidatus Eremiobacteraeota bacterium]|nr:response regulator transcription factor [Candidatus Eremiobacteraeota bacterium]
MSDARIMVVEDDPDIAAFERTILERAQFSVQIAPNGAQALELAAQWSPEVVLLDVGLPDISGLDVLTSLSNSSDAYILMVSAAAGEDDILRGLGLGADDYITKPFSPTQLVARIEAFLRRRDRQQQRESQGRLTIGNATLVRDLHVLQNGERSVPLTALEFRLLWYLGEAEGRLLTRAQILETVWNDVSGVPTRVVDVHVAALRKKLAEIGANLAIASVRGIGYRLDRP